MVEIERKEMRLIFMGSPAEVISPLKHIIDFCKRSEHELVGVISQPAKPTGRRRKLLDPPLAQFAKEEGLEVFQPESINDSSFLESFKALNVDVVVTAAYGQILRDTFLSLPKRGIINIHPSLLPHHRGATPVQTTLLNGEEESGVTILFTVKKVDAGNIILMAKSPIEPKERSDGLLSRLFDLGGQLIFEAIEKLKDPSFVGEVQDESKVTHCKKVKKEDGQVDWSESSQIIFNRYRALYPWPGCFTFTSKGQVNLVEMEPITLEEGDKEQDLEVGEFLFAKRHKAVIVRSGKGFLKVTRLKPAGSKEMDAVSFWNGSKFDNKGKFTW